MKEQIDQTLEMMHLLSRTEEYADCILWTGATNRQGYPIYKPFGGNCTLVRRRMYELTTGPLQTRVPIATTCGEKRCINPKHLKKTTASAIGAKAAARGAWSGKARGAKIAEAKRAKSSKITIEDARVIRMSDESSLVLASRYAVNRSVINGIKAGTRWRDYSNPFAGLMTARAPQTKD